MQRIPYLALTAMCTCIHIYIYMYVYGIPRPTDLILGALAVCCPVLYAGFALVIL